MPGRDIDEDFIARWSASGGGELSNYQLFLSELCVLLGVPKPEPAVPDDRENAYVFNRSIPRVELDGSTTTNFIDLYKRGCFICETKQGVEEKQGESLIAQRVRRKTGHGIRGSGTWDTAMEKARNQAEQYARALPASEGRPPFLLIVDVGYSIELFAEFTCTGGTYVRFPDPKAHRILLTGLRDEKKRETLRAIWTDPFSLDPARRSAKVTREIATQLAKLARSFEKDGHDPQSVAEFLMRCIFTMFAEDVRLLPEHSFKKLLESLKNNLRGFTVMVEALWGDMANGAEFSTVIREKVLHFNGGLFERADALPVTAGQLDLLIAAAQADWRDVEPAIFGTLLERALSPRERHKLGAHYTPRAYVERLVFPTVIDPLRVEWETVKTAAAKLTADADATEEQAEQLSTQSAAVVTSGEAKAAKAHAKDIAKLKKDATALRRDAMEEVRRFHHLLCKTRVLDPACGSANFLYVTMEHMKRLEGEVLELLAELGDPQLETEMREFKVRPHQFIGLEINPWAVPIAELVLWIGYLQWHFRTSDKAVPDDPVISREHSIHLQDAVLEYDRKEMITWGMARENPGLPGLPDEVRGNLRSSGRESSQTHGGVDQSRLTPAATQPVTVWDGRTMKKHPVTGRDVPDETARVPLWHYVNPRKAEWPDADFIVGNPPFIGTKRMIDTLGVSYAETLREVWSGAVTDAADFVMFWWQKAAELLRASRIRRFGFITTNSIHQTFNRRVIQQHLEAKSDRIHIIFAIPDHPWVDSTDGAAVRIAMTVVDKEQFNGTRVAVEKEFELEDGEHGIVTSSRLGEIGPDLRVGPKMSGCGALAANEGIAGMGVALHGSGFIVDPDRAHELSKTGESVIKPFISGADLLKNPRERYLVDFSFMSEVDAKAANICAYQHLLDHVKPERDQNRRKPLKENWWRFGWERPVLRTAIRGTGRFIGTAETSKHRVFQFIDEAVLPEHRIVCIADADAFTLAVLSSRLHVAWALAAGGRLEDRPVYNKTRCFDPFPFPNPDEATRERIRELGEQLDAHRKRQQALHPGLTLTGMYNVLERLRATGHGLKSASASHGQSALTRPQGRAPALTPQEKKIHEQGLVSVLKQIHDDLDATVFAAYGWPANLSDEEILERLVALNHERAAQEKRGNIRWLRPEFQCRDREKLPVQSEMIATEEDRSGRQAIPQSAVRIPKSPWPKTLSEQVESVSQALETTGAPVTAAVLAKRFQRANKERIAEILETLVDLGKARQAGEGEYQTSR